MSAWSRRCCGVCKLGHEWGIHAEPSHPDEKPELLGRSFIWSVQRLVPNTRQCSELCLQAQSGTIHIFGWMSANERTQGTRNSLMESLADCTGLWILDHNGWMNNHAVIQDGLEIMTNELSSLIIQQEDRKG